MTGSRTILPLSMPKSSKFEYLLDINVIARNIEKERVGELFTETERLDSSVNLLKDPYFDGVFFENREAIGFQGFDFSAVEERQGRRGDAE